jgi:heterodisulfide reductase subunit A-like polyferredoxin
MGYLSSADRKKIPRYDDPNEIEMGLITFNDAKCNGCGVCVKACPADTIKLVDKKAKLAEPVDCMACADCVAICPTDAITLVKSYRYTGMYKTINQGDLTLPRL